MTPPMAPLFLAHLLAALPGWCVALLLCRSDTEQSSCTCAASTHLVTASSGVSLMSEQTLPQRVRRFPGDSCARRTHAAPNHSVQTQYKW